MTTQHRQLILSGGIHHAFNQTSALLAPLGEHMGWLHQSLFTQMPRLKRSRRRRSNCLWSTHSFGKWREPNMMSSERIGSIACRSSMQRVWIVSLPEGQTLRPAHCEHLFLRSTRLEPLPGRTLAVARIVSSPNRGTFVNPTPTGEALGLTAFEIEDELYCSLHRDTDALPLMTARNADGAEEVVVWRKEHGEARSAYSALGHDVTSVSQQISSGLLPTLYSGC